jgi:hypothetical protein
MMDALQKYLDSVRDQPFQWGEHDCALFAAKGVDAVFGTSFVSRVKAFGCKSAREYRIMCRGGTTLEALTTAELGKPVSGELQRCDVVLVRLGYRTVLGLAVPPLVLIAGEDGLIPVPGNLVDRAWRVS